MEKCRIKFTSRQPVRWLLCLVGVAIAAAAAVAQTYTEDLSDGLAQDWVVIAGSSWAVDAGSYYHNKASPTDAVGRALYQPASGGTWSTDYTYTLLVRGDLDSTSTTKRKVGVVFNWSSASNYYEVLLTPDEARAELFQTVGGTTTTLATSTSVSGMTTDVFIALEIVRSGTTTTVKVAGNTIFNAVAAMTLGAGRIGVSDRANHTRFDDISVVNANPEVEVRGNAGHKTNPGFRVIAAGDTTPSGVDQTEFGNVDMFGQGETRTYIIANTGNAALSVSMPTITGTNAADFTITGLPSSIVPAGQQTTVSVWFRPGATGVRSATLNIGNNDTDENPYTFALRGTGTQTSVAYVQNFDANANNWTAVVGSSFAWNSGGYYYHNKASPTDPIGRAVYNGSGATWDTDYTYTLTLRGDQTSTQSTIRKVGAVYNYVDANNYYEVLITPDGNAAELRKKIGGVETPVASATLAGTGIAVGVYFDLEIAREGPLTTVKANGVTLFDRVAGQTLGAGKIGLTDRANFTRLDSVLVRLTPFKTRFPKLGGYNIGGKEYQDSSYQQALAKLDLVILGFYAGWNKGGFATPALAQAAVLNNIKAINPSILIGNYTLLANVTNDVNNTSYGDIAQQLNGGTIGGSGSWTPADWWARSSSGAQLNFDSTGYATNITNYVNPNSDGDRFPQWFARRSQDKFFNPPGGPTMDYDFWYCDNIFYKPRVDADWDRNGSNDSKDTESVRAAYRGGNRAYFDKIATLRPDLMIMGNIDGKAGDGALRDAEYQYRIAGGLQEGAMGKNYSEEKPNGNGWYSMMQTYQSLMTNTISPHLVVFNVWGEPGQSVDGDGVTDGYRRFRYGFSSALMEDGYFNYTDTSDGYTGVPWFDEYDNAGTKTSGWLGEAIDPPQRTAWSNGVFRRRFEHGCALVNPRTNPDNTTRSAATVDLTGQGYKRISGSQDSSVNNGANVTTITLQPGDGIVLQKQ